MKSRYDFFNYTPPKSNQSQVMGFDEKQAQKIVDQYGKITEQRLKKELELEKKYERLKQEALQKGVSKNDQRIKDYEKKIAKHASARLKIEAQSVKNEQQLRLNAIQAAQAYEIAQYAKKSSHEKLLYKQQLLEQLKAKKEQLAEEEKLLTAEQERLNAIISSSTASQKDKNAAQKALTQVNTDLANVTAVENQANADYTNLEAQVETLFSNFATRADRATAAEKELAETMAKRSELIGEADAAEKKLADAKASGDKNAIAAAKKELKAAQDAVKQQTELARTQEEAAEQAKELQKEEADLSSKRSKVMKELGLDLENLSKLSSKASNKINSDLEVLYGSQSRMAGRLQGLMLESNKVTWQDLVDTVSENLGFSAIVSQKNVVAKMTQLIDSGVAYNIELRALLAETSESIASTFNAFDSNLLRLIRLQQADSTAERLGLEAKLTELFNGYFQDTSYLANEVSDAISGALIDASATMTSDQAVEFEYIVQKWLGSLYSLGMSSNTAQTIAQGINYLASGDVSAFSGNASLQTLFAMSASRAGGKSYADMLAGGISAEDTNKLLRAMVEYLAEIANSNTDNRVVASAFADVFGMNLTDLRTFASLTETEIKSLYESTLTAVDLRNETINELNSIYQRISPTQYVNNIMSNVMAGTASNIGSNIATYAAWQALTTVDDLVDIGIPGITALGSGTTSEIDVLNLAKGAFVGLGLISNLIESAASGGSLASINLNNWNSRAITQRGTTLSALPLVGGASESLSLSAAMGVGSANASDIQKISYQQAQETAQQESGIESADIEAAKEFPEKIYEALAGSEQASVLSVLQEIDERLDPGRVFYTAIAGVLSTDAVSQVTNLSTQLATVKSAVTSDSTQTSSESTDGAKVNNSVLSNILGGGGGQNGNESALSLDVVIANAIVEGLRQYRSEFPESMTIPQGVI